MMLSAAARRVPFAFVPVVALLLVAGCGGGGTDTGGVAPGSTCIDFVPAAGAPVSGSVVLQKNAAASSCNMVAVDIVVKDVSDIHAAAFNLRYRTVGSRLVDYMEHNLADETLLDADGTSIAILPDPILVETADGLLEVGITRQPANPCMGPNGADVGATPQIVARLLFTQVSTSVAGTSNLTFEALAPELRDSHCPPQLIATGAWPAGMLVVQ